MVFRDIEQAIAERLAPLREAGILTRALPNKVADWGKSPENGVITIRWEKDEFTPPLGVAVCQEARMNWHLDIRLRNLRDEAGAWSVLQQITILLLGFRPPHCNPIYLRSREFLGEMDGVWVFEVVFIAPTYLMEPSELVEADLPALKGLFFDDQYGGLEVGNV